MVYLYEGTPGSGKSLHATARIYELLRKKHPDVNIICNYPVDVESIFLTRLGYLKKCITIKLPQVQFKKYNSKPRDVRYTWVDNSELTVDYLKAYCDKYHKRKEVTIGGSKQLIMPEEQTLVIIDEASVLFNCRAWAAKDRQDWCTFFAQHRHYGFNFILITQHETMLDKQIRLLIEIYVTHRNLRYYNWFAKIISLLAGGSMFIALYRWQGVKEVMSREVFRYNPRVASIYNSYMLFDRDKRTGSAGGRSPQGEGPTAEPDACEEGGVQDVGIPATA